MGVAKGTQCCTISRGKNEKFNPDCRVMTQLIINFLSTK